MTGLDPEIERRQELAVSAGVKGDNSPKIGPRQAKRTFRLRLFSLVISIRRGKRRALEAGEKLGTVFPIPDEYARLQAPLSKGELAEIRKQTREHLYQRFAQTTKIYAEQMQQQRIAAFNNSKDFAILTIRSVFILNGAAILALLTFISSFFTKGGEASILIGITVTSRLLPSLYCFSGGLVCASVVAALGYLNYGVVYMTYLDEAQIYRMALHDEWKEPSPGWTLMVKMSVWLAAIFGFGGLGLFIYGAVNAAKAFVAVGA